MTAESNATRQTLDHFTGCLLGGAVGDALGAAVEFLDIRQIHARYGPAGIADYDIAYGRRGAITDDTQMTLFTAEGLLRAEASRHRDGSSDTVAAIHHACLRWLHTQGEQSRSPLAQRAMDGWLIAVDALHARRAPGNTCLAALRGSRMGTIERPLNDSKGCGGVMRVAPVGLAASDARTAFALGCEAAAITHGHPSGYFSAGALAAIVRNLVEGWTLPDAIENALRMLDGADYTGHEECSTAIRQAVAIWKDRGAAPSPETIRRMGGGWVGEEALAIALYAALSAGGDFARGVTLAVNHGGDSDSTGAIAGNLLGLMAGMDAIPSKWLDELELREEIEMIAVDLHQPRPQSDDWRRRYP